MKTIKIICITATIIILALSLFKHKPLKEKYDSALEYNAELQQTLDSLATTSTLLEEYYCATENLLDSIFKFYIWQDVMDPYEYYDAVDNIYYQEYLYKYLENKRRQVYEQNTYTDQL